MINLAELKQIKQGLKEFDMGDFPERYIWVLILLLDTLIKEASEG